MTLRDKAIQCPDSPVGVRHALHLYAFSTQRIVLTWCGRLWRPVGVEPTLECPERGTSAENPEGS
jgi:hypothetical protein